jgi:hypothetical protein
MPNTSLTLGGFNQPAVARSLIELPGNSEKGLSQRFLWIFPKPIYGQFATLEPVDVSFCDIIVKKLSSLWRKKKVQQLDTCVFKLPEEMESFRNKYDAIQDQLRDLAAMDDLMSGMLSKSMGQILRVGLSLHILFNLEKDIDSMNTISTPAIDAAIDFVDICCQQTAFIAGRGDINNEIQLLQTEPKSTIPKDSTKSSNEAFVLTLPGKCLDVSTLVNKKKKFRSRGGREGAMQAMRQLEEDGLGKLVPKKTKGSVKTYDFEKEIIPVNSEQKSVLAGKLAKYKISLIDYDKSLNSVQEQIEDNDINIPDDEAKTPVKRPSEQNLKTPKRINLE